jgi:hypothetical protein
MLALVFRREPIGDEPFAAQLESELCCQCNTTISSSQVELNSCKYVIFGRLFRFLAILTQGDAITHGAHSAIHVLAAPAVLDAVAIAHI